MTEAFADVVIGSDEFNRRFVGLPLDVATAMMSTFSEQFSSDCEGCQRPRRAVVAQVEYYQSFLHPTLCDACALKSEHLRSPLHP